MSGPGDDGDGGEGDEELSWAPAEPSEPSELSVGSMGGADPDEIAAESAFGTGAQGDAGTQGEASPEGERSKSESRESRRAARAARVRRRRRIVAAVAGGFLVLVLGFALWYELESFALGPEGPQVLVRVHEGEPTSAIVNSLSQHGIIGSSLAFSIGDFFHGTPTVLPGIYALRKNQTFAQVRAELSAGPNVFAVDVRPGFTFAEVAQKVGTVPGHTPASFTKVAASGAVHSALSPPGSNDLEGMLGTGEYLVLPGESDRTLLTDMVQRFDRDAQAAGLSTTSAAALGLSSYQVLTAASVVEKEGYYAFNMPRVARVIYNRLAQGKPLQMDSTVLYAIGQDGGPVTPQDEQIQSPYNTYLNTGLPPTPICAVSTTALSAAVHPPPGSWLYFTLVQKDGHMAFSDTYAEQLANEKLAQSRGLP